METVGRCDACGNAISGISANRNFDDLYLTILEIGQSRVERGITYNELVDELKRRKYDISSGCTELAVKNWFFNAFFHKADEECPLVKLSDLDTHLECDFILKGETSLQLLEHQNIKASVKLAKGAIVIAVIVTIITCIGVLFTYKTISKPEGVTYSQKDKELQIKPQSITTQPK